MEAWRPEDLSVTLLASEDKIEGLAARKDSKKTSEVEYRPNRGSETVYRVHAELLSRVGTNSFTTLS